MSSNLEALKQITTLLQGAQDDLQRSNARAEAAAWARLKETLSDAIDRWTVDNVRGLVDEIMEERAEAAQEANQQALFEREQDEQAYLRRHGHYRAGSAA
jgi:hypothetical protein